MKVGICAIVRNENLYIKEWIDFHFFLGFDNIIIYDNNLPNTEKVSDVIDDERVIIHERFGENFIQHSAYTDCFNEYKSEFDWLAFIDIDEFIVIESHKNIKDYLSQDCFKDVDEIRLCWKHFTDNNELDVIDGDYRVVERFKTEIPIPMYDKYAKAIIHTNLKLKTINIHGHGIYDKRIKAVDALGNECYNVTQYIGHVGVHSGAWINHYKFKTIGEYIRQKYFRGGPNNNPSKYSTLFFFFQINEKTDEKIEYANKLIEEIKGEKTIKP